MDNQQISRIDRYTCKFENPVMEEMDNHENQAIKCAVKMRERLVDMNVKWEESELSRYWSNHGIEKITARTGVHTGSIIVGNIGSERMLQYSAIGDVVNVASRLEQANQGVWNGYRI